MQLEANQICFSYRKGEPVLQELDFCLRTGERVALTGPSGQGKSTLAMILAGYQRPDSGVVTLDGVPLWGRKAAKGQACKSPVQLIYQHPEKAVNPRWRMRQVLEEGGWPEEEILSGLGIEKAWFNRFPAELSGGELQRFCIARSLSGNVRFLIADEISTMLDVMTQAQIWNFILDQVESREIGLLVITHNQHLAERISQRQVCLKELQKCE